MKSHLFVSGPADGKRIVVCDNISVEIPIFESMCHEAESALNACANFSKIKYIKHNISKNCSVYIPIHFMHDQVMKKLIENYCTILPES